MQISSLPEWRHSKGKLLALTSNIRLGLKRMSVANALAYYDMAAITSAESFVAKSTRLISCFCSDKKMNKIK